MSEICVTSDILLLQVPLREGYAYPTVNAQIGQVKGKKSPAYHALAEDVEAAGREARAQGWVPIEYPCYAWFTLYTPDQYVRDALNIAGCEANALTRATVWTDDTLANPVSKRIVFGAEPPRRVTIVVQRLASPAGVEPRAARPTRSSALARPATPESTVIPPWSPGDPIRDGYALCAGKLVPYADALALIGRQDGKNAR